MKDCCSPTSTKEEMKGGKMDKKIILWIIIALLVIGVIYVTFFKGGSTANVVNAANTAGQVASSGMVGGC